MAGFSPKNRQLDWSALDAVDIDALAETGDEDQLEDLYTVLVSAEAPSAAEVSSEDLVRLFRLSQLVMELKHLYLVNAERTTENLEAALANQKFEQKKNGFSSGGAGSDELTALQDALAENQALRLELNDAESQIVAERVNVQDLKKDVQKALDRTADAEARSERAMAEAKDLREQTAALREKAIRTRQEEEAARATAKDKSKESERYLREIEALSEQYAALDEELESVKVDLDAAVAEIENNERETDKAQQILSENDRTIEELKKERDGLLSRLDDVIIELERNDSAKIDLQRQVDKIRFDTSSSRVELADKEDMIRRLQAELTATHEELDTYDVDEFRKILREKDDTINTLRDKLEESYKDFQLLSTDWDQIENLIRGQEKDEKATLSMQQRLESASKIAEKLAAYQKLHKADQMKIRELEGMARNRDEEALDTKTRLSDMEKGIYGLEEAAAETRTLGIQMRIRDKNILELTKQVNELQKVVDDCLEENDEFRERLGLPPDAKIETKHLAHRKHVEIEQLRSVNDTLRQEIDRLEEERLSLKSQLRLRALERGNRAVQLGLSVDDLIAVEDYASKLREGQIPAPASVVPQQVPYEPTGRPNISNERLDRLLKEFEKLHVELKNQVGCRKDLEESYKRLSQENQRLQDAVKEIGKTLVTVRGGGDNPTFPAVKQLLIVLEKRLATKSSNRGLENVEEDLVAMNRALREENEMKSAERQKLILEATEKEKRIADLLIELSEMKSKKRLSSHRTIELPETLSSGGTAFDFENLNAQLVECLHELDLREGEISKLHGVITRHEETCAIWSRQQHVLYTEYEQAREEWKKKREISEQEKNELELLKEQQETRVEALETLVMSLGASPDEMKSRLIDLSRKVLVFRVNEKSLSRRQIALTQNRELLRKENERLKDEMLALDNGARQTIGRLQRSKQLARDQVDQLQVRLANSVSAEEAATLRRQLDSTIVRLQAALEKEAELVSRQEDTSNLHLELAKSKEDNETLQAQYAESQSKLSRLDALLTNGEGGNNSNPTAAQQRIASLEAQLEHANRKFEMTELKLDTARQAEKEQRSRENELEDKNANCLQEILALKESEILLNSSLAGCLPPKEWQEMEAKLETLQQKLTTVEAEVQKSKEMAEISSSQLAHISDRQVDQTRELELLRSAITDLEIMGDDKLAVGRLHDQMVALHVSEAATIRNLQDTKAKCLRLENSLALAEQAIDERDNIIFHIRLDAKIRLAAAKQASNNLRSKNYGSIPLDRYEKQSKALRSLDLRRQELQSSLATMAKEKWVIEGLLGEAEQHAKLNDELLNALKDPNGAQERLAAWHQKMADSKISQLRLSRQVAQLLQAEANQESVIKEQQRHINDLEDELAAEESAIASKQMDWERRESELENQIEVYEEERERIFRAATTLDPSQSLPDANLPIGEQLEFALRRLAERARTVVEQNVRIATLEARLQTLSNQVQAAEGKVVKRDLKMAEYDVEDAQEKIKVQSANASTIDHGHAEAALVAQKMVASLQLQLRHKEKALQKYQSMLSSVREEAENQKELDRKEISRLTERTNELSDAALAARFKQQFVPSADDDDDKGESSSAQTEYIESLEAAISKKEGEIASLTVELHSFRKVVEAEKLSLSQEIDDLRNELTARDKEIGEKAEEIAKLEDLMQSLREETTRSPSKTMKELVFRLKSELEQKGAREGQLEHAIRQLKVDVMEGAASNAEHMIKNLHGSSLTEDGDQRIKEMCVKLERAKANVEKVQRELDDAQIQNRKLKEIIDRKERENARHTMEEKRLQKLIASMKEQYEGQLRAAVDAASRTAAQRLDEKENENAKRKMTESEDMDARKERLNAERQYQKKLEGLKRKLDTKTNELEEANKQLKTLRTLLERSEARGSAGRNRSARPSSAKASPPGEKAGLEAKYRTLEEKCEKFEKIIRLQKDPEISQLQLRERHLNEQLELVRIRSKSASANVKGETSSSTTVENLEKRFQSLMDKTQALEKQLLDAENKCLEARFEQEKAVSETERLLQQVKNLEQNQTSSLKRVASASSLAEALESTGKARTVSGLPNSGGAGIIRDSVVISEQEIMEAKPHELRAVIEQLTRVVDRLKEENEQTKKGSITNTKYMKLVKENAAIKKEKEQLQEVASKAVSAQQVSKVESENAALRKSLRRETDRSALLEKEYRELKASKDILASEAEVTRKRAAVVEGLARGLGPDQGMVTELQEELKNKDMIIEELCKPDAKETDLIGTNRKLLREVEMWKARVTKMADRITGVTQSHESATTDRESLQSAYKIASEDNDKLSGRLKDLEEANEKLTAENDELREELGSIDPGFFEDLEDMKYNYKQAVQMNIRYEEKLRRAGIGLA